MKPRLRSFSPLLYFIIVSFLFVSVAVSTESFNNAYHKQKEDYTDEKFKRSHSFIGRFVLRRELEVQALVIFVTDYHDALDTLSTIAIAAFTLTLWLSTDQLRKLGESTAREQKELIDRQIEISDRQRVISTEQHIASHRPRIIVRNMQMPYGIMPHETIYIRFYAINVGETTAEELRCYAYIDIVAPNWRPRLDMSPAVTEQDKSRVCPSDFSVHSINMRRVVSADDASDLGSGREFVVCCGVVTYKDAGGVLRRTGFARKHQRSTGRFDPFEDDESEYQY